jgi:hypothetical protein
MTGFLRRSLLQAVAGTVLFAGAGASDVFANTTYLVTGTAVGSTQPVLVCTLYLETVVNGMPAYTPVAGNIRKVMTLFSTTPSGFMGMNTYIFVHTWHTLTPGRKASRHNKIPILALPD